MISQAQEVDDDASDDVVFSRLGTLSLAAGIYIYIYIRVAPVTLTSFRSAPAIGRPCALQTLKGLPEGGLF